MRGGIPRRSFGPDDVAAAVVDLVEEEPGIMVPNAGPSRRRYSSWVISEEVGDRFLAQVVDRVPSVTRWHGRTIRHLPAGACQGPIRSAALAVRSTRSASLWPPSRRPATTLTRASRTGDLGRPGHSRIVSHSRSAVAHRIGGQHAAAGRPAGPAVLVVDPGAEARLAGLVDRGGHGLPPAVGEIGRLAVLQALAGVHERRKHMLLDAQADLAADLRGPSVLFHDHKGTIVYCRGGLRNDSRSRSRGVAT